MAGGCKIFSKLFSLNVFKDSFPNSVSILFEHIARCALRSIEYSAVHNLLQIRGHIWILPPPGNLVIFVGKFFECLKRKVAGFLGYKNVVLNREHYSALQWTYNTLHY